MAEQQPSGKEEGDIESRIEAAILPRLPHFRNQSDSLTYEGVRRLLEKDLGLETHALDSHKRFIKQQLQKSIESAVEKTLPKSEPTATDEPLNKAEAKKDSEKLNSGGGEIMEDSPVMGLLSGPKKVKGTTNGAEEVKSEAPPSEAEIKEAVWKRASYLKENSESITLGSLRRLLEEDLGLEKHTLDPFKKFISSQVDDVLAAPESPLKTLVDKKKTAKNDSKGKVPPKSRKEKEPTPSGDESDDVSEEEVKAKKKTAPSTKTQKTAAVKKRKRPEEDSKGAKRKQSKASNSVSDASGDEDGGDGDGAGGDVSENENSESSAEKPAKLLTLQKKEAPKPSYGRQVEHLKSVIKSCGMSIPPVVYKKVKQAPENKRESCLIKELEEILSKEGLSSNPSEKDIKEVKKRKDRTKELEGIDMSNIVVSSRRRSAASFAPPPKPKIPDLSESESEESEENSEDDDDEVEIDEEAEDEEGEAEGEGDDQEDAGDGSASDGSDKGESDGGGSDGDGDGDGDSE